MLLQEAIVRTFGLEKLVSSITFYLAKQCSGKIISELYRFVILPQSTVLSTT